MQEILFSEAKDLAEIPSGVMCGSAQKIDVLAF